MNENLETPLVQSGDQGGAASTPAAPVPPVEPVAPATPSTPPSDAEARKSDLEKQIARYEADIRAIKSTSDKRFNDAQRQWQEQQARLQKELQSLRMSSMDEDERKQYEANLAIERQQEIEQELNKAKMTAQEYQANLQAIQYFLAQGVPAETLVIDQGYDTLFNSGMEWMNAELKRLRSSTTTGAPPAQPNGTRPTPPVVATASSGVPSVKPTWDDLRKKYGDDEQIYRLVEAGLLPSDIIPTG